MENICSGWATFFLFACGSFIDVNFSFWFYHFLSHILQLVAHKYSSSQTRDGALVALSVQLFHEVLMVFHKNQIHPLSPYWFNKELDHPNKPSILWMFLCVISRNHAKAVFNDLAMIGVDGSFLNWNLLDSNRKNASFIGGKSHFLREAYFSHPSCCMYRKHFKLTVVASLEFQNEWMIIKYLCSFFRQDFQFESSNL